jgi:hypothetical protein
MVLMIWGELRNVFIRWIRGFWWLYPIGIFLIGNVRVSYLLLLADLLTD